MRAEKTTIEKRPNSKLPSLRRVVLVAVYVELVTSAAIALAPAVVVRLLLGADLESVPVGQELARLCAIALFALVVACWPSSKRNHDDLAPALRGMAVYNALVMLLFGYFWLGRGPTGVLLLPAWAYHAVLSVLLVASRA